MKAIMVAEKQLWLDDPYEVEGFWYPSFSVKKRMDTQKYRRHGKLTYSPSTGAFLRLYHDGPDLGWGDTLIYCGEENSSWYDKITCLGISHHTGGRNSTIFRVDTVFRGFHLPNHQDANVLKLDFSIKHLNQWLTTSGFKFNRNPKNASFTVRYKESSGRWLKLNDLSVLSHYKSNNNNWL
jgi:hypothetical protein